MAPFEFRLPDLGEGVHDAQVLAWKVTPGQEIRAFDALCEVESAKAAVELTAPVGGRVLEMRVAEGATARTGEVLVLIATDALDEDGRESPARAPSTAPDDAWFGIVGQAPVPSPPTPVPSPATQPVRAAPLVRRIARERGIALEHVVGSGPQGRIRLEDLDDQDRHETAPASPARPDVAPPADAIPLVGLRRAIADHMVEAWRHAPQVTAMDLVDVTELVRARDLLQAAAEADGAHLTYLAFFVKAAVEALKAVPAANARLDEPGQRIQLVRDVHVGIATAIEGGLVVPVVRHADRLSILELAREIERLVGLARERRATPRDLSGSTFTITSYGALPGSPLFATPIVNYPEVAILGIGRIDLQPRVVGGQIVARQCAGVSFTFDHRVLDGEDAGRFIAAFRRPLEQPLEMLLRLR